jgi:hypothetical protein
MKERRVRRPSVPALHRHSLRGGSNAVCRLPSFAFTTFVCDSLSPAICGGDRRTRPYQKVPTVAPSFSERCPLRCRSVRRAASQFASICNEKGGRTAKRRSLETANRSRIVRRYVKRRIELLKRRARGSNPQPHYWGTTFPVWPLTIRLPSVNTYPTLVCATQFRSSSPFAGGPAAGLPRLGRDDSTTTAS